MKPTVPREHNTMSADVASILVAALENNVLNIDIDDLQSKLDVINDKKYLDMHPYKIWFGVDQLWHTYLPDDSKKYKRAHKKRTSEKAIKKLVVDFWKEDAENPTVEELYYEWITGKVDRKEIAVQTKERYDRQFKQCFSVFGKKRIKDIRPYDIEEFILNTIFENQLSQKNYGNLRIIINGIFKRARKQQYVSFNIRDVLEDIELSKNAFRKDNISMDKLVFSEDETEKVINYLMNNKLDIIALGILLLFKTGLRPGELVALMWCDIENNILNISRSEVRHKDEHGKEVYEVSDSPKTEAGIRSVVLPEKYIWIIDKIRELNPTGEFVFERNGIRLKEYNMSQRLKTVCKNTGIPNKSLNKIRKTYATILLDANIEESVIKSQMGHKDISTTRKYYQKDRKNIEQKTLVINNVAGL